MAYVTSILSVVILSIIADLMLSGKRMGKFVRAIFAVVTMLMIAAPLPSLLRGESFNGFDLFGQIEADENFLGSMSELKQKALSEGLVKALEEEGYRGVEVTLDVDFNGEITIKSVKVNLSKMVMDANVSHINKYEAVEGLICRYLGVDKELVELYE